MKTSIYTKASIIFRIPTYVVHEVLHLIPAILFKRSPKLSMNIDLVNGTASPCVDHVFSGFKYKEFIIGSSPILGLIIPLILSIVTFNPYIIGFTIYQFINIRYAFLSKVDIDTIKDSFDRIDSSRKEAIEEMAEWAS